MKKQSSTGRGKSKKQETSTGENPEPQDLGTVTTSTTLLQTEETTSEDAASSNGATTTEAPEAPANTEVAASEVSAATEATTIVEEAEVVAETAEVAATVEATTEDSEVVAASSEEVEEVVVDVEEIEEVTTNVEEAVAASSTVETESAEKSEPASDQGAKETPAETEKEMAGTAVAVAEVAVAEVAVESPEADLPAPKKPLSALWIGLYMLASLVGGLSSVCIKQLLLPLQVQHLDPQNFYISFTLVASLGAFAGFIASPLSGALSDRTTSRLGRRRPWIIGSITTLAIGLVIMAFSTNIPILLVGEIIAQLGADALLATTTAIIPDQVPLTQRSIVAAFNGMAPIVGGTLGLLLITKATNPNQSTSPGYILLAVASVVLVGIFLLVLRERQLPKSLVAPFRAREFFGGFVIRPKQYPGFLYVIISRFLIFLSFTILGAFSVLYFQTLGIPNARQLAPQNVALFQLISTIFVLVGAIVGGWLSKRVDRLKPFVIIGALLMTIALITIGLIPSWDVIRIAAGVFGTGFGLYLGVDIALAVRVLPSTRSSGKDLGILHLAIFLALILSPIFGNGTLALFNNNFTLVFGIAALSSLVGAVLILPVKSAR